MCEWFGGPESWLPIDEKLCNTPALHQQLHQQQTPLFCTLARASHLPQAQLERKQYPLATVGAAIVLAAEMNTVGGTCAALGHVGQAVGGRQA